MMFAQVDGQRSYALPNLDGHCELCGAPAIPKCGPINVWHWAHKTLQDCDTWAEPATQWHTDWQHLFPPDACEIPIGRHRADVRTPDGLVIEFQHSTLSADDIRERENHYGRMLWVFDAVDAYTGNRLLLRRKRTDPCPTRNGAYRSFRWKHPRRSLLHCRRPVFLDLGDGAMLELKRLYPNAPYGGWGYLTTVDAFLGRCGLELTFI